MESMRQIGLAAVAVLGAAFMAGCATISESKQQVLMVHTVLDNREIGGVGCVLTNDAGRWFVTAPGRVVVQKSAGNLFVDCKGRNGIGQASSGQDVVVSKANTSALVGNVTTAGLGYLLDKRTGAGFDYPDTLTVIMRRSGQAENAPLSETDPNPVF